MSSQYELRSSGGAYDHFLSADDDNALAPSETRPLYPLQESAEGGRVRPAGEGSSPRRHAANVPHVSFRHVRKDYVSNKRRVTALDDINLEIATGEIFGVIGRSGAGKSTLLRTINRLESIDGGSVEIDGERVDSLRGHALVGLRRRIGMIFQHFNLLSSQTVFQNLALPAQAAGLGREEIKRRAERLLTLVGLEGKADVYPRRLSGGQKQRVGIARALMLDPEILLCDEATSALDPETTQTILALLRDINKRLGLTIVLITHEMAVIREICDRVAVLDQGRLIELAPVWQVFGAPRHPVTASLLAPLAVKLPPAVAARVTPSRSSAQQHLLLALDIAGEQVTQGVDIAELGRLLGSQAQLIHGSVEQLQGHVHGRLLITLASAEPSSVQRALADAPFKAEIIGYV